jgi:hypothetical protein
MSQRQSSREKRAAKATPSRGKAAIPLPDRTSSKPPSLYKQMMRNEATAKETAIGVPVTRRGTRRGIDPGVDAAVYNSEDELEMEDPDANAEQIRKKARALVVLSEEEEEEDVAAAIHASDEVDVPPVEFEEVETRHHEEGDSERNRVASGWLRRFLVKEVPFNIALLPTVSQRAVKKRDELPTVMCQCVLHAFSEGADHKEYSLVPLKGATDDLRAHAESFHSGLCSVLDTAQSKGLDLEEVWNQQVALLQSKTGKRITDHFSKRNRMEKSTAGLLPRHEKAIVLVLLFVENDVAFYIAESTMWPIFCKIFGVELPGRKSLRNILDPIYFIVLQERQRVIKEAGFCHTLFDFYNAHGRDYLLINYQTALNGKIHHFPLDCLEWRGRKFAGIVMGSARTAISLHLGNALLASNHVDGALLSAGDLLVGTGDNKWCSDHLLDLLQHDIFDIDGQFCCRVIALDILFIHHVSVHLRLCKKDATTLDDLVVAKEKKSLRVLLNNDTSWDGLKRMVNRFVRICGSIVELYKADKSALRSMIQDMPFKPEDFLKKPFYTRLQQLLPLLRLLNVASKTFQSRTECVGPLVLFYVAKLQMWARETDVSDVDATVSLRTNLLLALDHRFGKQLKDPKGLVLKSAAVDPRTAHLQKMGIQRSTVDAVWDSIMQEVTELRVRPLHGIGRKMALQDFSFLKLQLMQGRAILEKISSPFLHEFPDTPSFVVEAVAGLVREEELAELELLQLEEDSEGQSNVLLEEEKKELSTLDPLLFYSQTVPSDVSLAPLLCLKDVGPILVSSPAGTGGAEATGSVAKRSRSDLQGSMSAETHERRIVVSSYIKDPNVNMDEFLEKVHVKIAQEEREAARKK